MQALHELTVEPLTYCTALEFEVNIIARRSPTIVPEQRWCLDNSNGEMNRSQQNDSSQTTKRKLLLPLFVFKKHITFEFSFQWPLPCL